MSCTEQRQKRWRKASHGGLAFSALGNITLSQAVSLPSLSPLSWSTLMSLFLSIILMISLKSLVRESFYLCTLHIIYIYIHTHTYIYTRTHTYLYSAYHALFFLFLYFSSCSLFFLPRLRTVDQWRNIYRRIWNIKKYIYNRAERGAQHMNGTFSGSTCCKQLGHAASHREFSRSVLFGMDEARRVTAPSSHEIQSRIFAPDRSIFEEQHKRSKSQSHGLLHRR